MAEGTVFFADEPVVEVTAPIVEAQLVETAVINFVHLQTVLASKAVRSVLVADERAVVDFGLRRTHGIDAGMAAARCAFIAGASMTSNTLASYYDGIPATGTMAVRQILDEAGLSYVRIFVSGGLDEDKAAQCLAAGAPIDAFGIGTRMNVSADAPYLDMAYKVRYEGRDVLKLSPGKVTWPGEKHVYRLCGADGSFERDVLALREERPPSEGGEALLRTVMTGGRRLEPAPSLSAVRGYCAQQVAALPESLRRLVADGRYVVEPSARLASLRRSLEAKAEKTEVSAYRD